MRACACAPHSWHSPVCVCPWLLVYDTQPDSSVVIACDGVFDFLSNKAVGHLLRLCRQRNGRVRSRHAHPASSVSPLSLMDHNAGSSSDPETSEAHTRRRASRLAARTGDHIVWCDTVDSSLPRRPSDTSEGERSGGGFSATDSVPDVASIDSPDINNTPSIWRSLTAWDSGPSASRSPGAAAGGREGCGMESKQSLTAAMHMQQPIAYIDRAFKVQQDPVVAPVLGSASTFTPVPGRSVQPSEVHPSIQIGEYGMQTHIAHTQAAQQRSGSAQGRNISSANAVVHETLRHAADRLRINVADLLRRPGSHRQLHDDISVIVVHM